MNKNTCKDCCFAVKTNRDQLIGFYWCYRYPPVVLTDRNQEPRPLVEPNDWCGEFFPTPSE